MRHHRFDAAAALFATLQDEATVPGIASADSKTQFRLARLLLDADALLQAGDVVDPCDNNAIAHLQTAIALDPDSDIARDMLAKAEGFLLQSSRAAIEAGRSEQARANLWKLAQIAARSDGADAPMNQRCG